MEEPVIAGSNDVKVIGQCAAVADLLCQDRDDVCRAFAVEGFLYPAQDFHAVAGLMDFFTPAGKYKCIAPREAHLGRVQPIGCKRFGQDMVGMPGCKLPHGLVISNQPLSPVMQFIVQSTMKTKQVDELAGVGNDSVKQDVAFTFQVGKGKA